MGKICWINGQPYLVSLPRGGKSKKDPDRNNPWNKMIEFLGENSNEIFHWENMFSWCQESVDSLTDLLTCVVRGGLSARFWTDRIIANQSADIGFRPVLKPLDPDTLKPDASLMEEIPDGTRIALTSLYIDGKVIAEPKTPTYNGDIADYIHGAEIALGNRDEYPGNWLHVIKFRDLLWMDRNILKNISWEELEAQWFTD